MKKLLTFLTLLTLFFTTAGAAEKTITLDVNAFGATTTYGLKEAVVDGFTFVANQIYKAGGDNAGCMQFNKSTSRPAKVYNETAISGLKSVTINYKTIKTYNVTDGNASQPSTNSQVGGNSNVEGSKTYNITSGSKYFMFELTGTGACYLYSIVVTYEESSTPATTYNVNLNQSTGGTISASTTTAAAGAIVTVTATANPGYEFDSWTAPTNVNDWDEDGNTATFTMPEGNVTVGASFTEQSTSGGDTYKLVTKASELVSGAQYLITNADGTVLMGAMEGNNATYANQVTTGFTPNSSENTITLGSSCEATPITLGGSSGAWTLYNGSGFIAYTSNTPSTTGTNNLWLVDDASANGAVWNISIPTSSPYSSQTLIVNVYNNIRSIRYNSGSTRFAGYGTGQAAIALYKKVEPTVEKAFDVTVTQATGGTIYADPEGENVVDAGDKITVTATPDTGYELTGWTITGASETEPDANNQITATGDVTITATFSKIDYALTRSSNDLSMGDVKITDADGNILDPQPAAAQAGDVVYFKLTTNYGYQPTSNPVTVTNTTSSTTITVAGPDDESGVYSFTMPAGNVNIAATFQSYHGTLRLAGHFNGNTTWRTGNSGPAFTYDNNSDTYTIDAYFTGIDDNGYNDFFFLTLDGVAKHPKADNGNYYISDLNGGEMPFELSGGDKNNFGCAPGVYHIEINGALTSMKFTKQTLNISFDPVAGEVEIGTNVSATSALTALINNVKAIDNGENGAQGTVVVGVNTDNGNTWNENVTLNTVGNATVYGKAYIGNINATGSATYTVVPVNTSTVYQLVTSTDDLIAGKRYIIMNSDSEGGKAMGAQDKNNRSSSAEYTITNGKVEIGNDVQVIILEGSAGAWNFNVGDGYLYAAGANSNNYLKTEETVDNNGNANAAISFGSETDDNEACIVFQGTASRNTMRFNNASDQQKFSCYAAENNQEPVYIYRQVEGEVTLQVAKPTFTPAAGTYTGAQSVTISCATEGATIYYSTNGTVFHEYTEAITVSESATLYAKATKADYDDSEVAEAEYVINAPKVATPVFNPGEGTYTTAQNVTITCATEGATILYSTDGETFTEYTTAIAVSENTTLYAKATKTDYDDSEVAEATYTFVAPGSGNYILVTKQSDIKAGREYVIVSSDYGKIMGSIGNNDYGTPIAVEASSFNNDHSRMTPPEGANILTLGGSEGAWTLQQKNSNYVWLQINGTNIYSKKSTYTSTDKYCMQLVITYNAEDGTTAITESKTPNSTRQIGFNGSSNKFGHWANSNYVNSPAIYKKVYLYYKSDVENKTLAQIEADDNASNVGTKYAIADPYLVGVASREVSVGDNSYVYVWCKDNKNATQISVPEGAVDFMRRGSTNAPAPQVGDWDQSNWVVLRFNNVAEALALAGSKLTNVVGTYVDNNNYMIDVESYTKGDTEDYTPNVYCVANFNPYYIENGGLATQANDDHTYFFMTPKVQEVCTITFAEWNGTASVSAFQVPASSGFEGTLTLGWDYNQDANGTPVSQTTVEAYLNGKFEAAEAEEGETPAYKFLAVVQNNSSKGAVTGATKVYPMDLVGEGNDIPTAISSISAGNGVVKSVKYVNVAGMVSDVPFQGVNIVVTEYSDGSRSTSKILRK